MSSSVNLRLGSFHSSNGGPLLLRIDDTVPRVTNAIDEAREDFGCDGFVIIGSLSSGDSNHACKRV